MNQQNNEPKEVEQHGKAGRPTKYDAKTEARLLAALSDGLTYKQACIAAGIGQSTLADWRERYPDLQQKMDEAREVARQKALSAIKAAGQKDWRAWAEWLRLCFPEYRKPDTRVEVNAHAQSGQVQVVCDEATRRRLIEARNQLLRDAAAPQSEQKQLQAGVPIGATYAPEDPKITMMKELEGCITHDQILSGANDLGRFGNTDWPLFEENTKFPRYTASDLLQYIWKGYKWDAMDPQK